MRGHKTGTTAPSYFPVRGSIWIVASTVACSVLAGTAWPKGVLADSGASVAVHVKACPGSTEIRRVLVVELGARLVPWDPPDPEAARIELRCVGEEAVLRVVDPTTGKETQRTLDLGSVTPSAQARLLALAAVELLVASWAELVVVPPSDRPIPAQTASPSARARARRAVEVHAGWVADYPWRITTIVSMRALGPTSHLLWGGGLGLEYKLTGWLGVTVDVLAEHGDEDVDLGSIDLFLTSAGLGIHAYAETGILSGSVGLGWRLGVAHFSGIANEPDRVDEGSVTGAFGGPEARIRLQLQPLRQGIVSLGAGVGWASLDVGGRVAGSRTIAIDSLWISAHLAVGLLL